MEPTYPVRADQLERWRRMLERRSDESLDMLDDVFAAMLDNIAQRQSPPSSSSR